MYLKKYNIPLELASIRPFFHTNTYQLMSSQGKVKGHVFKKNKPVDPLLLCLFWVLIIRWFCHIIRPHNRNWDKKYSKLLTNNFHLFTTKICRLLIFYRNYRGTSKYIGILGIIEALWPPHYYSNANYLWGMNKGKTKVDCYIIYPVMYVFWSNPSV